MSISFYVILFFTLLILLFVYRINASFREKAALHKLLTTNAEEITDPAVYEQVLEKAYPALGDFLQRGHYQSLPSEYKELHLESVYQKGEAEFLYTVWIYTSLTPQKSSCTS